MTLFGLALTSILTANEADDWLQRMDQAAQTLNYQGDFVFLRGGQMRHMQVLHLVNESGAHVRITAVDGPPIEILAHGGQVSVTQQGRHKALPGSREVLFSAVLPQRLWALRELYTVSLGGTDRVANLSTQIVEVKPVDNFRFGFRLWAATDHGLLLKAVMLNHKGEAVEQYSFSRVELDPEVTVQFAMGAGTTNNTGNAEIIENGKNFQHVPWEVTEIPAGYALKSVSRYADEQQEWVDHLLFSDGLATISVFVEPLRDDFVPPSRTTNMGGVSAVTGEVSQSQVTVMGEVPAATLSLMLNSVKPVDPIVSRDD